MRLANENILPEQKCLNCGVITDRASGVISDDLVTGPVIPEPGSITICIECGHIMAFAGDLTFRQLTDDEMKQVAGDPRIIAAQTARLAAKRGL